MNFNKICIFSIEIEEMIDILRTNEKFHDGTEK